MGFKQAKKPTSGSTIDFEAFNKHLEERVDEAIEENGANMVCIISQLIDSGVQPPEEPYTVYDWVDDEKQNSLLKKDFGCYVEDGKFYIPNRPTDTVIIAVDFPDIMVNYDAFFSDKSEDEQEERPYRHLIAGEWKGVAGVTMLTPRQDGYTSKAMVSKLAKATKAFTGKGKVPFDFDLEALLGKPLTMDVEVVSTEKDGNYYVNVKAQNPSIKHKQIKVPKNDIQPKLVFMNGENEEEAVKELRTSVIKRLMLAEEFEDSDLKELLKKLGKLPNESSSGSKPSSSKPATKPSQKEEEEDDDEEEQDDTNPFLTTDEEDEDDE